MNKIFNQLNKVLKNRVMANVPLAKYVKLQIGGLGEFVFEANNEKEIDKAKQISNMLGLNYKLIKMYEDVLILSKGLSGLIIIDKTNLPAKIELKKSKNIFTEIIVNDTQKEELKNKGLNVNEFIKGNNLLNLSYIFKEAEITEKIIGGIKLSFNGDIQLENINNATAEDVMILISYIKQRIRDKYNLQLIEKIKILNN